MKTKTKFICVTPTTAHAQDRFVNIMEKFHSCRVQKTTENKYYLESLNKQYYFWVNKEGDANWRLE